MSFYLYYPPKISTGNCTLNVQFSIHLWLVRTTNRLQDSTNGTTSFTDVHTVVVFLIVISCCQLCSLSGSFSYTGFRNMLLSSFSMGSSNSSSPVQLWHCHWLVLLQSPAQLCCHHFVTVESVRYQMCLLFLHQ